VGDWDAPRVLALLSDGKPFVANLRVGKHVEWEEPFGEQGYADVKAQVAAFCRDAAPEE
jgi:hypothetical protein